MDYYIDPTVHIVTLVRQYLNDPTNRISLEGNKSYTANNESVIKVSAINKISHITDVKVDGVALEQYREWFYDPKFRNLVFKDAQSGEVTYNVYVGTNWIYHDRPLSKLSDDEFPRIAITPISSVGTVLGNDKAKIVTTFRFQINTFCKKQQFYNINLYSSTTEEIEGQELANYINQKIYEVFDTYREELHPLFSNYELNTKKQVMGEDNQLIAYSTMQEFTILHTKEKL